MVATVDGRAWESNWTKASGGIIGPSDVLYVGGFGDSLEITLALPGPVPALGTYRLADGSKGNALVSVLTATGWIVYYTDKGHFGYVTVSRADSTIAGDFYFDTWNGSANSPRFIHVRGGAFHVRIEANSEVPASTRPLR